MLIKNLQNLQLENGMLSMMKITQTMVKKMRMIQALSLNTKVTKANLCDYSDANILVTVDITATGGNANTKVAFKNYLLFTTRVTHIDNEHVDTAEHLDIIMPMYDLIDSSDKYSDTIMFMTV